MATVKKFRKAYSGLLRGEFLRSTILVVCTYNPDISYLISPCPSLQVADPRWLRESVGISSYSNSGKIDGRSAVYAFIDRDGFAADKHFGLVHSRPIKGDVVARHTLELN